MSTKRCTQSDEERAKIIAAMDQLLTVPRPDSARWPGVSELARVAGVKRWVLTHKHTDLKDQFQAEVKRLRAVPSSPAAPQRPSSLQILREEITRLRRESAELRERIIAYEHALLAVGMEYHGLVTSGNPASKVRRLPVRPPFVDSSHHLSQDVVTERQFDGGTDDEEDR